MIRPLAVTLTVAVLVAIFAAAPARADEAASAQSEGPAPEMFPLRVDEIRIEGLVRSKPFVVRRELGFTEGDVITKADFDLAVTRLWNTTIFARVAGDVVKEGGRTIVVLRLEDRWTLNPLFSFGSGGNAFYFRVGAADNNLLGRYLEAQALYEYFDGFHGGQAIYRDPRLFDRRMGLAVQVDRLVRPRQGFSDQRTRGVVEISHLFMRDRMRLAIGTSVFADRFLDPLQPPVYFPQPTETSFTEAGMRIGRIDIVRIRQRGVSLELRPGVGFTSSDVAGQFATMTGEALGFWMVGERWNFAGRFRAANTTNVPPHLQLWAGGLDLLRGFPDNYVRTNAFALVNLEARFVAFDSTWVAFVPTAFVDAIGAQSPSGAPGTALSVGGGVRVLVPKFVGTGLRADLAIPVHSNLQAVGPAESPRFGPVTPEADLGSLQPSFGVYQFF